MSFTTSTSRRSLVLGAVAVGVLLLGGCSSGDDDSPAVESQPAATQEQGGQDPAAEQGTADTPEGFEAPDGVRLADGLIPELSEIPLPDSPAVFEVGVAYDAETDPRETAQQQVHFTMPQEVADFYDTELAKSGFKVTSDKPDVAKNNQAVIEFTDGDGIPGRIFFSASPWAETKININLFRSGTA